MPPCGKSATGAGLLGGRGKTAFRHPKVMFYNGSGHFYERSICAGPQRTDLSPFENVGRILSRRGGPTRRQEVLNAPRWICRQVPLPPTTPALDESMDGGIGGWSEVVAQKMKWGIWRENRSKPSGAKVLGGGPPRRPYALIAADLGREVSIERPRPQFWGFASSVFA